MINNQIIMGKKLPKLDNPGGAGDLLVGKQLVDADGNLLTGTMPKKSASDLSADGPKIIVPSGYYDTEVSKSVTTTEAATPSISVSSGGLITATTSQGEGYVEAATKDKTYQMTTKAAITYTPSTTSQTISAGTYLTGTQTIQGSANLVSQYIKNGVSIFGVKGTYGTTSWNAPGLAQASVTNTLLTMQGNTLLDISTIVGIIIIPSATITGTSKVGGLACFKSNGLWFTYMALSIGGEALFKSYAVTVSISDYGRTATFYSTVYPFYTGTDITYSGMYLVLS